MKRYNIPNMTNWKGRIDDLNNYDAFRWHQWIIPLDLENRTQFKLKDNQIGIAFIGFLSDEGVKRNLGRTGASKGPASIRKELCNLPCSFLSDLQLYDAGDITCDDGDLEKSQHALSQAVSILMNLGLIPIVLGGGHEVAYGSYLGIKEYLRSQKIDIAKKHVGIINFDAHFDLRPYPNKSSSGTMFRQIADLNEKNHEPFDYFCIGIQKRGNTVDLFKTAERLGTEYLLAKDIGEGDLETAFHKLDAFIEKQDYIYLTICTDVFSSAFAPGVSASQPLGLHPERVLRFFKHIFKSKKVVCFDIAEVSPRFDQDNITANLAATFVFSAVNSIASLNHMCI